MKQILKIRDFTDPTCPFCYALEPTRWRLKWLYGDQLEWEPIMIVLSETVDPNGRLTPEMIAGGMKRLKEDRGMPTDDSVRSRLTASIDVCRAYEAVALNQPEAAELFLRQLRIAIMTGALADEPATITRALQEAKLDKTSFKQWIRQPAVEAKLRSDMKAARQPSPVALTLNNKLGRTSDGQKRYSGGSYVFYIDQKPVFELPGFWPAPTYEAVAANLLPRTTPRANPTSVTEVLSWAEQPLATAEVASVMNQPPEKVSKQLVKTAKAQSAGHDKFWNL